jgi:asparagine synthase (glutamine-hydrolysing)
MCGITGFIGSFSEAQLHTMTRCLAHRGPDAEGFYFDPGVVGLGHRRLSILDLSEAGNQPFYSRDGRYIMVFNGEVYNFRELAIKYKISPRTHSDSEIILEAFAQKGIESVNDFNGMFSIVIWDRKEHKLYLIRDRIGIKPLYYYSNKNNFAFASELKALFSLPIEKKINKNSISNFLYLGYIPGEDSIYVHCKKIPAGHYGVFYKGQLTIKSYWQLEEHISAEVTSDEGKAKKSLKSLIESSVNYCMISDVPVGIFLSGGVDSSIVAAVAQTQSSTPVKTFSIGFNEAKYNESKYAAAVAGYIKSNHQEFIVKESDAMHLIEKILDVYDEPYADGSAIPTLMVSQMASQHVKVALSGDGGDELFMGYGFYYWARRLGNPFIKAFRQPIAKALNVFGDNRLKRGSKLFQYPSAGRRKSHIFSQEQYNFTEAEIDDLLINGEEITIKEHLNSSSRILSELEEQSFFDIKNYLPEELLVKTDRASMYHSLEVRVPLLDHRLVEFALNVSPDLKLRGNTGKYLLKQVLYDYIPASFFDRPKWGFSVPLRMWLSKELKHLIDKYLDKKLIDECGIVYSEKVEELKKSFFAGKDFLFHRIWCLIILHKWYTEKFIEQDSLLLQE